MRAHYETPGSFKSYNEVAAEAEVKAAQYDLRRVEAELADAKKTIERLQRGHELLLSFNDRNYPACCQETIAKIQDYSLKATGKKRETVPLLLGKGTLYYKEMPLAMLEAVEITFDRVAKPRTANERPRLEQFDLFEDWQTALRIWLDEAPEEEG